ncbi:hypothetical protein JL721_6125 [Aureococcus anophagefferens]|nr:hypothetical protein JL721_6125 [Aureococcus anophagefferens]
MAPRRSSRLVETAAPAEEGGDLLKVLDDLEAKEALDVSDVVELYRALSLDSAVDASAEARAFALVDPAVQAGYAGAVDAVALEACALTLARGAACPGPPRKSGRVLRPRGGAAAAAAPRDASAPGTGRALRGRSALMMRRGDWDVVLPRDALAGCCVAVANRSRLGDARVQLTHQVAALLGHDGAAVRCRALKALDGVARERGGGDAPLLRDPVVRRAVLSRFLDEAISVHAAAVDLVGNHALDAPETLLAYHGELLERLLDAGVSVRKAVVRILEKSLAVRGEQLRELHKRTLLALLDRASRPKEEQTVKDLVGDVIRDAWFAERGADEEAAAPEKVSPSSVALAAPDSERLAACATLSLAARAKRHLKRFYRLGDARCVEYVPGDRKLHDKGLPQRGAAPDLDASPPDDDDDDGDWRAAKPKKKRKA